MDRKTLTFKGDDLFNRRIVAENFMKIFEENKNGLIVSINSGWGTGKTTFVNMWEDLINKKYNEKYETLYFNAWENDYIQDPLLAILSEIELEENIEKSFFKSIKTKGKKLIKPMLNTGLKILTHEIIDLSNLNLEDYIKNELPELTEKIGDAVYEEIIEQKKTRQVFKEILQKQQEKSKKTLIFFIDELDRCKPTFAIELLEVVKHLFNIKGIIFVISLDKEQLSYSVQNIYGQNMNVDGYLRRFFDLEFKLPQPSKKIYFYKKYDEVILSFNNKEIKIIDNEALKIFKQFLLIFIKHYNFSLRDIDRLIFYIKNLIPLDKIFKKQYTEIEDIIVIYIYAYMVCLQIHNSVLYKKIIELEYIGEYDEIIKTFELETIMNSSVGSSKDEPIKNETVLHILNKEVIVKFLKEYKKRKNSYDFMEDKYLSIYEKDNNIIFIEDIVQYNISYLFNDINKEGKIIKNLEFMNAIN